jgi:uncharacterized protein with ParB-like and HNH nuclease domain
MNVNPVSINQVFLPNRTLKIPYFQRPYVWEEKNWEKFYNEETQENRIFYIWGHSYEMDAELLSWEDFDSFCAMISKKENIFYGTNSEVLLHEKLYK